jgi:hypothetical protein
MSNGTCADGGRFATGSLFAPGEYTRRSDQAHLVISLSLCASTVAYAIFFFGAQVWPIPGFRRRSVERVPLAYAISGASTVLVGLYLMLRVLFICDGATCWPFLLRDLVQQQHGAIAA